MNKYRIKFSRGYLYKELIIEAADTNAAYIKAFNIALVRDFNLESVELTSDVSQEPPSIKLNTYLIILEDLSTHKTKAPSIRQAAYEALTIAAERYSEVMQISKLK